MKILKIKDNFDKCVETAVKCLAEGGLVVYPTETCYGIGADALNQSAVDKLLSYKRRREGKPMSVLVKDLSEAEKYVDVNDSAKSIYDRFLPGPVTVVSYVRGRQNVECGMQNDLVADGVVSELGTLGIRISSHPFAMKMAENYGNPITATSANASWKKKPYCVDDVLAPLSDNQKARISLIIDAGELPKNESSTVIDTTLLGGMVVREGDVKIGNLKNSFISITPKETMDFAKRLILKDWNKMRKSGLVFALSGDLGVGKTIFSKGIGEFLKIKEAVVSPSYTLVNEYEFIRHDVRGIFYHLDPWRLESFSDLLYLGFEDMLKVNNVVAIEWASKFADDIRKYCLDREILIVEVVLEDLGGDNRRLSIV